MKKINKIMWGNLLMSLSLAIFFSVIVIATGYDIGIVLVLILLCGLYWYFFSEFFDKLGEIKTLTTLQKC